MVKSKDKLFTDVIVTTFNVGRVTFGTLGQHVHVNRDIFNCQNVFF